MVESGPARRHPDLAAERGQRDADAGPVLDPVRTGGQGGDLVERVRELVGQQAEAGDRGRPAPVRGLEGEQLDLDRPGSARALHRHRPLTWSTRAKSSVPISAVVDSAVSWPNDASRQSNSTTLPDGTVATGG